MTKAKKLFFLPLVIVITILVSLITPVTAHAEGELYEPRLTAPDSSIPYYSSKLNYYFRTGTPMPNCVAYAYGRIYEMNGEAPLISRGSAGDWYFINKRNGYYEYGMEPKLGAVACWSRHVAIVEAINDDGSVTISESHWGGRYFDVQTYSSMSSHYGQRFYGYIYTYNNGLSKKLEKKLLNATNKKNDQYMLELDTEATESAEAPEVSSFGISEQLELKEAASKEDKFLSITK